MTTDRRLDVATDEVVLHDAVLDARLAAVGGVVFDIDGCLILAGQPAGDDGVTLPGAPAALRAVRGSGRGVVVFTNASGRIPSDIATSLVELGFDVDVDDVLTPSVVAAEVLRERYGDSPVLAFGGAGLRDVLHEHGVVLGDVARPHEAVAVVVGWDLQFDQPKLQAAAEAVWNGAALYSTSDAKRVATTGRPTAGVGGFLVNGLSFVTGAPYEVLGKPSPAAMAVAARRLGVPAERILVAGDDLGLESAMARASGGVGVLVTTGMHGRDDADTAPLDRRPDLVVDSLTELVDRIGLADRRTAGTAAP